MQVTLGRSSALAALRALRCGTFPCGKGTRCDLPVPQPEGKTWTKASMAAVLAPLGLADFAPERPLEIVVPHASRRVRVKGVVSIVRSCGLPRHSFLSLGRGISISSPELIFVEMASQLSMPELMVLGFELCGTYSILPSGEGVGAQGIQPVTTAARLRDFVSKVQRMRGMAAAAQVATLELDNVWSPMEAVLACLLMLPVEEYGYGMGPIALNQRFQGDGMPTTLDSRVPDIIFPGTSVGLNYDGGGHFGVDDILGGIRSAAADPSVGSLHDAARAISRKARRQVVSDKRRDRDLSVMGLTILPVTSEDLYEVGGLDKVVLQTIALMEREGSRTCASQRRMIERKAVRRFRQQMVWSLLPGTRDEAKRRLGDLEEGLSSGAYERVVRITRRRGNHPTAASPKKCALNGNVTQKSAHSTR